VPCPNAGFEFESVSPFSLSGLHGYWKRAVRYGRRRYEFQLLGAELKKKGLAALPADITALYGGSERLALQWAGIYTVSNWAASFGEDLLVGILLYLALAHPVALLIVLAMLIVASLWLLPKLWRFIRAVSGQISRALRGVAATRSAATGKAADV